MEAKGVYSNYARNLGIGFEIERIQNNWEAREYGEDEQKSSGRAPGGKNGKKRGLRQRLRGRSAAVLK